MKFKNCMKGFLMLMSSVGLFACGGSDSSAIGSNDTPTGVTRTGTVYGAISGFGSVYVNGVRYDTDNASFTVDDAVGSESDLKVGQVVTMKTETDAQGNARATKVTFDDEVEGPISAIDLMANSLIVLGQTILVDGGTSFDDDISPASLEGLVVGDIVEVSGFVDSNGDITATRIELKGAGSDYEIHGYVSLLDTIAQTFMLNGLLVDYRQATLDDFGNDELTDGDLVEVKGTDFGTMGELLATKVELEDSKEDEDDDDREGDDGDEAEFEGLITEFTSSSEFSVAGMPVITTSDTEFEGGVAADLALDVRVEVEGEFNADGVLVADEIEFEHESSVRISAPVDAVDTANSTITVLGIEFSTDISTRFEDQSDTELTPFSLSDINAGDYVELRGRDSNGSLYASQIERDEFESKIEIQGFVESIGTNDLVVLGITITTDDATEYEDFDDATMAQADFFNALSVGSLIEAEGTVFSAGSLLAEELEFENED